MFALAVAASIAAASPAPPPSLPSPYFLDNSFVVQVTCEKWLGTAFYIGDGKYITARHVMLHIEKKGWPVANCEIMGQPVKLLQIGYGPIDYALISAPVYLPYRAILSCGPIVESKQYYASGYASGNPWSVTQRLIGTRTRDPQPGNGYQEIILRGSTTEGQSGGPVSDEDGVVFGIVSAGADGGETTQLVLALADTPYCGVKHFTPPTPSNDGTTN